jgi:hypothetical protein
MMKFLLSMIVVLAAAKVVAQDSVPILTAPSLAGDSRFFELRTYHAAPGKLEALQTRFRDHTTKIFAKHGMQVIGFWVPMTKEGQYENTLVYMLAFPNRQAHDDDWKAFSADPEWQAVKTESEKNGKLTEKVESQFLTATDYSPLK